MRFEHLDLKTAAYLDVSRPALRPVQRCCGLSQLWPRQRRLALQAPRSWASGATASCLLALSSERRPAIATLVPFWVQDESGKIYKNEKYS